MTSISTKHSPVLLPRFEFDPILSVQQAASIVGCHADTLKAIARKGKLTILRLSARRLGIRQSELNRYLAECEAA
jgi:excisionase family DNA binding protein